MSKIKPVSKITKTSIDGKIREEIKQSLRMSLLKYVGKFKYKSTQPLDLLIPKERKIRSLVGDLETSMGTTVWEPVAKTLASMNGYQIISDKILRPSPFPIKLASELAKTISLRENKSTWIPINECILRFRKVCKNISKNNITYVRPAAGTGVDIWIKKGNREFAFDTKTVQPNLGNIKSFNKQILEWYAFRICKDPDVNIECKIAYPYNPYKDNFWKHNPHTSGILQPGVDALVENEFWDTLSGFDNTYQLILEIFAELNNEGLGKELSSLIEKMYNLKVYRLTA
jgi:Type II restriction endonuclease, TdeIII